MIEEEVKLATCQVLSKEESGTGWLISSDLVLTAYHCVATAAAEGEVTRVRFGAGSSAVDHAVVLGPYDEDLDVCLLRLPAPLSVAPIPFDTDELRPGEKWFAFGYPAVKLELGHVLVGEIQQVLIERLHRVDLDLSVEPGTHLSDYQGLSGSALMVGAVCKGLLRLNIDSAIGAVSLAMLRPFLEANGLLPEVVREDAEPTPVGSRPAFDELFESTIIAKGGGYIFVDGSHGVGKSTYCLRFRPESSKLDAIAVYPFTERARGSTPAHQAQPEVFFDWANSLLSSRATGRPARLMELSYPQLIEKTGEVFQALANRCSKAGRVGVLFIDGINEVAAAGEETLRRFVNLLPHKVPDGLVVVITGVGLDAIAGSLGSILQGAERLLLPTLERDIQYGVCIELLDKDKATAEIVATLCDRAMGHPLYLRYLADLVNSGATEGEIAALPVFSGAIEDYYETIWAQLVRDGDVVNLLGIIARLRWGIPVADLAGMLTVAESGVFTSTLIRIRHLLSSPENTAIYHPSFSEFVVHKTSPIDEWVHTRIAGFCSAPQSGDYGVLNKVYHGLKGGREPQLQAIRDCQQTWIDDSVLLGAEPDVLLTDIENTLATATRIGTATDVFRLLLLSQRLTFRYNTLFVQSAELVALALISLGKTEEALRHVVRNGRLVVRAEEAFAVAHALTQVGENEQALEVLELIQRALNKVFERLRSEDGVNADDLLGAVNLRLHAFSLAQAAGDTPPFTPFLRAVVEGILRGQGSRFLPDEGDQILRQLTGEMLGSQLCLQGRYRPYSQLGVPGDVEIRHQLLVFLNTLAHAEMYSEHYGIALKNEVVELVLSDIGRAIDAPLQPEDRRFVFTDTLIEAGAAPGLVEAYSVGVKLGDGTLPFYKKNRADPDKAIFESAMLRLRAAYFLEEGHARPAVQMPSLDDWEGCLEAIARGVAWSDGKARKAMSSKDQSALDDVWSFVVDALLPCFSFGLSSRIYWESSYAIPETIVPPLYGRLTKLFLDCYPTKVLVLLKVIERAFDVQLGLYNEGFRQSLQEVLGFLIKMAPEGPHADKAFALVLRWRDYVAANVQNRFELVPELLQIVPLLARMGATEEALKTYQLVLSFSMGPSWYKEDQLSMMTGTLEALPAALPVSASSLAQIAGFLERATGEMTFQRFVRADKGTFIGQLCRRSLFADAVRYFQHQSCGTLGELHAQATDGNLDRVSPLVGMRFPGAALEEQAALLTLLRHSRGHADWRLRWALLEIYQHGDERHLNDWGREYAAIIAELRANYADLAWAKTRVRSIAYSLNSERASLILSALVQDLPTDIRPDFQVLLEEAKAGLHEYQIEKLNSGFGLRSQKEKGHEEPSTEALPEGDANDKPEDDDDRLFMPGTFGRQSAARAARAEIAAASLHLARRNFSKAIQGCIGALRTLQAGGWSVWTDNHSCSEAVRLISTQVQSADELARLYGPLVLEERHVQPWVIASHLVTLFGEKVDSAQQAELLAVAIDHVRQIVGDASPTSFSYIGRSATGGATEALFELVLWTLDHPAWERRDSGAAMVLWLARTSDDWLAALARLAVSMDRRNRADIASAVLDILSHEDPAELWQRISPRLDVPRFIEQCRHASRFVTFMRIAERASKRGVSSATEALKSLREQFAEASTNPTSAPDTGPPSFVPPTLYALWRDLFNLGVLTENALQAFAANLVETCSPLAINVAFELEDLVATGGRESPGLSTGRWATTVRYALNTALFYPMPASLLSKVEATLRTYNPGSLVEPANGKALLANLVSSLESGRERNYLPSNEDLVYLDLQCFLELDRETVHVELISHLVPPGPPQTLRHMQPSFKATELPRSGHDESMMVCDRARPTIAYFGSMSPAIPTPRFLYLTGAKGADSVRYHWRDGSTVNSLASSRRHEVALLAIRRDALSLPTGWQIRWTLRVNGAVRAVLNKF